MQLLKRVSYYKLLERSDPILILLLLNNNILKPVNLKGLPVHFKGFQSRFQSENLKSSFQEI